MDRELFSKLLETESTPLSDEDITKLITIRLSLDEGPKTQDTLPVDNLDIIREELSELSIEISKHIRGKREDNIGLIEELADVMVGIRMLKLIFDISDETLDKAVEIKIREIEKVNKTLISNFLKESSEEDE